MRLRSRQRIRSACLGDFKPGAEPRRVRGANCIGVEARVRTDPSRACSTVAEMNCYNVVRLPGLNEDRRDDFASLISQLNLVGDYLAANPAHSICSETVDVLAKFERSSRSGAHDRCVVPSKLAEWFGQLLKPA